MLNKNAARWALAIAVASLPIIKLANDWRFDQMRGVNDMMFTLPFGDLLVLEKPGNAIGKDEIRKFESYFRQITRFYPAMAEAHAMRGFCLYHLGQGKQALLAYQKAIVLNPEFLWFYYDAGMICLNQGDHGQAAQYFQKALMTQPQITMAVISRSKIFNDILAKSPPLDMGARLKQGYELSMFFGRLSTALAQNPGAPKPQIPAEETLLRVF